MSVYIELNVKRRTALSRLTEKWSEEEVAALKDGDKEAMVQLKEEAERRALTDPDEVDVSVVEVFL